MKVDEHWLYKAKRAGFRYRIEYGAEPTVAARPVQLKRGCHYVDQYVTYCGHRWHGWFKFIDTSVPLGLLGLLHPAEWGVDSVCSSWSLDKVIEVLDVYADMLR